MGAALMTGACNFSDDILDKLEADSPYSSASALQSAKAALVAIAPEEVDRVDFAAFLGEAAEGTPVVTQTVTRDAGGAFRHTLSDLLAADIYTFTATALDENGDVLFRGSATAEVRSGEVTSVLVVMTSEPVDVESNTAPAIHGLVLSNSEPAENELLVLDIDASDADGDALTATWTATGGAFSGSTSDDPLDESWTTDEEGDYTLTVTISDDRGASTAFSIDLTVVNGIGSAEVDVAFNMRPTVAIQATSQTSGEADAAASSISLRAVAEDADGDEVSIAWESSCDGEFGPEGTDVAETTFVPSSAGSCSFTATASDEGGANAAVLVVDVACVPVFDGEQEFNACAIAQCVADSDPCEGLVCGTAVDSCGRTVACGELDGACADGGVCSDDQTTCEACEPDPDACGDLVCGEVVDAVCGQTIQCGECSDGQACSEDQLSCEPVVDACNYANPINGAGICREYPQGYTNANGDDAAAECAGNPLGFGEPGTFAAGTVCDRAGLVGKCSYTDGSVDLVQGSDLADCDLDSAELNAARACEELAGGTWTCLL